MTIEIQDEPMDDAGRKMRQLETQVKELRRRLDRETKRADMAEDLRDTVFGLKVSDFGPPAWPRSNRRERAGMHTPILFTSDKQYGEVVKLDEMDGMNEFNRDIFLERYDRMIAKTVKWAAALADGWGAKYEHIVYLRGGDEVSGDIHAELRETNDAGARDALRQLGSIESEGIRRLKEYFRHVHVISIPGNHGRLDIKPRHKSYVNRNYETILADLIQCRFEKEPGVTFETPESGFAFFKAQGWAFEMRHGDRMGAGGGTGFIGAPAPITKGHKKIRLDAATLGNPVDYVLTGHLHTSMKLPRGFANGSFPGYNEFARGLGLDPDCAKQWLIFASQRHVYGIELELSDFPRRRT